MKLGANNAPGRENNKCKGLRQKKKKVLYLNKVRETGVQWERRRGAGPLSAEVRDSQVTVLLIRARSLDLV